MSVRVGGGKYTFCADPLGIVGIVRVLRYDQPWTTLVHGFNAIGYLMHELDAARVVLAAARALGDEAPPEIKAALEKHTALVDDREPPSPWCGS